MTEPGLRVEVLTDAEDVARRAQELLYDAVLAARSETRRPMLGLDTGAALRPLYARVAADARVGAWFTEDIELVGLEEHLGASGAGTESIRAELTRLVLDPWGLPGDRLLLPPDRGTATGGLPSAADLAAFESAVGARGGPDIQLLGIGSDGRIAGNLPGTPADSRTRVVGLGGSAGAANPAASPEGEGPGQMVSQGLATIRGARRLLVLATGASRAAAVEAALARRSPASPASLLPGQAQLTFVLDRAAASRLEAVQR